MERNFLDHKRVLLVDDEPDVLETLEDLLSMCDLAKAYSFNEAKELLETQSFDIAILDIMGVDGYTLLDIANQKGVISVMLTAHALSVKDTIKSYNKGAVSYIPKEEMSNIVVFLNDVLEAREKGKNFWWRWLDRLGAYYERKFGQDWKEKDRDFWNRFGSW